MKSFVQIPSYVTSVIQKNLTSEIACKLRTGGPVLYPGFTLAVTVTPAPLNCAGGARENRAGIDYLVRSK